MRFPQLHKDFAIISTCSPRPIIEELITAIPCEEKVTTRETDSDSFQVITSVNVIIRVRPWKNRTDLHPLFLRRILNNRLELIVSSVAIEDVG